MKKQTKKAIKRTLIGTGAVVGIVVIVKSYKWSKVKVTELYTWIFNRRENAK